MPTGEFIIISDDDGHHYVCPADRQMEADAVLEAITNYWRDPDDGGDPPEFPTWVHSIGGAISRVKFKQYRIEG